MKSYLVGALAMTLVACGTPAAGTGGGPISVDAPQNSAIGFLTGTSVIPGRSTTTVYPREVWTVSLTAGTAYTVLMCKTGTVSMDPYLSVTPPTGTTGEDPHTDDDSAGSLNSRVVFTPTVTGTYTIYASVFSAFASGSTAGTYRLSVLTGAMNSATCPTS